MSKTKKRRRATLAPAMDKTYAVRLPKTDERTIEAACDDIGVSAAMILRAAISRGLEAGIADVREAAS